MTRTFKGTCTLHFFRNAIITCHLYIPKGARIAQSVCLAKELGEKWIMIWFLAEAQDFFLLQTANASSEALPTSFSVGTTTPTLQARALGWRLTSIHFSDYNWVRLDYHSMCQLFTITPKTLLHFERIYQIITHFSTYFQQLTKHPLFGCFLSAHIQNEQNTEVLYMK